MVRHSHRGDVHGANVASASWAGSHEKCAISHLLLKECGFVNIISDWWFGTFLSFPYIGNVIIPTDEIIFFRGGRYTTNQMVNYCIYSWWDFRNQLLLIFSYGDGSKWSSYQGIYHMIWEITIQQPARPMTWLMDSEISYTLVMTSHSHGSHGP